MLLMIATELPDLHMQREVAISGCGQSPLESPRVNSAASSFPGKAAIAL